MCVSIFPAEFFGTTIMGNLAMHPQHGEIMVIAYENTAENRHSGANAMLLHFPSRYHMSQENFVSTEGASNILADMRKAATPITRGGRLSGEITKGFVEIFKHGIYTVVLTDDASQIPNALHRVPVEKRPGLNQKLFDWYAKHYKGYGVALCCFNNRDAKQATPLMVWYTPQNPGLIELPAIDCHTGETPYVSSKVYVDHWLILSSYKMPRRLGSDVNYQDNLPREIIPFLPSRVIGRKYQGYMANGDFAIETANLPDYDEPPRFHRLSPPSMR